MRRLGFTLAIFLATISICRAQDETEFLISTDADRTGFGGLMIEPTLLGNKGMVNVGGGGGMLVDGFFFGGYGLANVGDAPTFDLDGTALSFHMGQGGFWAGYLFRPEKLIHFGGSARFGWAGMDLKGENIRIQDDLFLISPQAEFEVNVLPYMKFNLSAGYRFAFGANNPVLNNTDFQAPFAMVGFYFGSFGEG